MNTATIPQPTALLELRNISKTYSESGIVANRNISISLYPGEIHALLGENGSGKSTLMHVTAGILPFDSGTVICRGIPFTRLTSHAALHHGIGLMFQELMLLPHAPLWQNIILGAEMHSPWGIPRQKVLQKLNRLQQEIGIELDLQAKPRFLSSREQHLAVLLHLLYRNTDILLLDEPTVTFTEKEKEGFFSILKKIAAQNKTILFITHQIEDALRIADSFSVLRRGSLVLNCRRDEADKYLLADAMLSKKKAAPLVVSSPTRTVSSSQSKSGSSTSVFEMQQVTCRDKNEAPSEGKTLLTDISFALKPGEITALTGIREAGLDVVESCICGNAPLTHGEITIMGKSTREPTFRFLRENGVGFLPRRRKQIGADLQGTVAENLAMAYIKNFSSWGILQRRRLYTYVEQIINKYAIQATPAQKFGTLSGGNQQRLLIARELEFASSFLYFYDPSRGLDFLAQAAAAETMRAKIERDNIAVLIVTPNIEEALQDADRILVLYQGRIAGDLKNKDLSQAELGDYLLGLKKESLPGENSASK